MDQKDKKIIVGIGEILWDLLPEGKQLGGAPANFAYHAQALGGSGFPISAVGDDDLGRELQTHLRRTGLDQTYLVLDEEHPTGTVSVKLDDQGVPDFTIHENVAWDFIPYTSEMKLLAPKVDAVCFGSLAQRSVVSRNTIAAFLDAVPGNCIKIFDVNLRQSFYSQSIIDGALKRSNVVKLNEEELPIVAGMCHSTGTEIEMLTCLREQYQLHFVVLTKGSKGSILLGPEGSSSIKAPAVTVADTVGAGDAFTAAVIMGLLQDLPMDIIQKNATMLAAYVCSQHGAIPKLSETILKELML